VDLSLYKLMSVGRKRLNQVALFKQLYPSQDLLMDVNKSAGIAGQFCVGLIHRYLDSNLRI
jgi:hypothetical protein